MAETEPVPAPAPAPVAEEPAKRAHEESPVAENGKPAAEASEPAHKRQKKPHDYSKYAMNINQALDYAHSVKTFASVMHSHVGALHGMHKRVEELLKELGVDKMSHLADWKYYKVAKALLSLEELEEAGKRRAHSEANLDKILDKEHRAKSIHEILDSPPSSFKGIGPQHEEMFEKLKIKTVRDLAQWKYPAWAESIKILSEFEEKAEHNVQPGGSPTIASPDSEKAASPVVEKEGGKEVEMQAAEA